MASLQEQLKRIEKQLQKKIKSAMKNEVAETAKDVMVYNVVNEVYSKYKPAGYKRRYDQGGLIDKNNIETTMIDDNTLQIENVTRDDISGRYVAPVVEFGVGYEWENSEIYYKQPFPRPFMEKTANELEEGKAKEALKKGLKRQGIKCE